MENNTKLGPLLVPEELVVNRHIKTVPKLIIFTTDKTVYSVYKDDTLLDRKYYDNLLR